MFDHFVTSSASRRDDAATGHRSSAMSPIIWLSAASFPTGTAAAVAMFSLSPPLAVAAFVIGSIPPVAGVGMYVYFGIVDRDRLHTEDYRLRTRIIDITEAKGGRVQIEPVDLPGIANPRSEPIAKALKQTETGGTGE